MEPQDLLLSKGGKTTRELARLLIPLPAGAPLPTVAEMRQLFGTGTGTIQKSLQDLEHTAAVRVTSHGHLGSILQFKDISRLWQVAGYPTLTVAMPLPQSVEFEALATAIYSEFERLTIPFDLAFMHGALPRLDALQSGKVDALVSSQLAAERTQRQDPSLTYVALPASYYDQDSLVVLSRVGADLTDPTLRVAIDRRSVDHAFLTDRYFPDRSCHDCAYTNIPAMIAAGKLDIAMWHTTSAYPHYENLAATIPEDRLTPAEREALRTVALMYRVDSRFRAAAHALDMKAIATTAAQVRAHQIPVRY